MSNKSVPKAIKGTLESKQAGTRQHFIPEFYQRGFISDKTGLIWVYGKPLEPRQLSVRKTGMAINFYAFTKDEKFDYQSVENALQKIDNMGARIFQKIDRGEQ